MARWSATWRTFDADTLLAPCTCASIVVCYGGNITLGRSVYGCETRRLSLTDRGVAIAALNVICFLRVFGIPVARTAQGGDYVAHTLRISWTLFKVTPSRLVTHCGMASFGNVSVSPHNQI